MMVDVFGRLFGTIFSGTSAHILALGKLFSTRNFLRILTLVLTPQIFCEQIKEKGEVMASS